MFIAAGGSSASVDIVPVCLEPDGLFGICRHHAGMFMAAGGSSASVDVVPDWVRVVLIHVDIIVQT